MSDTGPEGGGEGRMPWNLVIFGKVHVALPDGVR